MDNLQFIARKHSTTTGAYDWEDLYQTALIAVWRSGATDSTLAAVIGQRAMIDEIRKLRPGKRRGLREHDPGIASVEFENEHGDSLADVMSVDTDFASGLGIAEILEELSVVEREVFVLRALGYTQLEIAERYDRSDAWVCLLERGARERLVRPRHAKRSNTQ